MNKFKILRNKKLLLIPVILLVITIGFIWFSNKHSNSSNTNGNNDEYSCTSKTELIKKINDSTGINLEPYIDVFKKCFTDLNSKGYDNDIEFLSYMNDTEINKFINDLKLNPLIKAKDSKMFYYDPEVGIDYKNKMVPWKVDITDFLFMDYMDKFSPEEVEVSLNLLNNIPNFGGTQLKVLVHKESENKNLALIEIRN